MGHEKDHARVKGFPPLVALSSIIASLALDHLLPLHIAFPFSLKPVGIVVGVLGFGLILVSARALKRGNTHVNPYKPSLNIVEAGPYRLCRNPIYLGLVLILLGIGFYTQSIWVFLAAGFVAVFLHYGVILPEEAYLEAKFGDTYRQYKSRYRRWL